MVRREIPKHLLTLILFTVVVSSCSKASPEAGGSPKDSEAVAKESDVERTLALSVSNSEVRGFAFCQLRSAIWGGYDVIVEVEAAHTADRKARRFEVTAGRLRETVSDVDLSTRCSRASLVTITAREVAFDKGVPFFIDEVRFAPPDSLSFRVWSNPAMTIKTALSRLQSVDKGQSGYTTSVEIVVSAHPITRDLGPRTITMKESRLDGWVLSLVNSQEERCLVSNEIELASLLTK